MRLENFKQFNRSKEFKSKEPYSKKLSSKLLNESGNQIDFICRTYNIRDYNINDDLTIDVNGDVDISGESLTEIPLTFNEVKGYFNCSRNKLTSLKGSPRKVLQFFECNNNPLLTSLEYSPLKVSRYYDCESTGIKSLDNITQDVDSVFCGYNDLKSLEGLSESLNILHCDFSNLTTLKGCPKKVKEFYFRNNYITDLKYFPEKFSEIWFEGNPICNIYYYLNYYDLNRNSYEIKELTELLIDYSVISEDRIYLKALKMVGEDMGIDIPDNIQIDDYKIIEF